MTCNGEAPIPYQLTTLGRAGAAAQRAMREIREIPMEMQKKHQVVVSVQMPFGSMVVFMVKWSLATIPAVIILVWVALLAVAFFTALGAAQ